MNVLVVEPGYAPYEKEIGSEQDIEALVGSSFEIFYPAESNPDDGVIGIRNPEAEEQGLPFNRRIDNYFRGAYGTFFLCGFNSRDNEWLSLTPEQIRRFKAKFHKAEIFLYGKDTSTGYQYFTMKVAPKEKMSKPAPEHPPKEQER